MQGRWVSRRARGLLAALIMLAPSFGASAIAVELRGDPGGPAAGDIAVTRPDVEIPLRLDNDSLEKAELTLISRAVRVFGAKPCVEGEALRGDDSSTLRSDPNRECLKSWHQLDFGAARRTSQVLAIGSAVSGPKLDGGAPSGLIGRRPFRVRQLKQS